MITAGCATSAVRSLGRTTVFDGPRVVIVWTNGVVGIKDVRYTLTEPFNSERIVTQRYYRVTQPDIVAQAKRSDSGKSIPLDYSAYQISPSDPMAPVLDAAESAGRSMPNPEPEISYVYCLSKGFGGVNPLQYPLDVRFSIGTQFSQKVDEYRTTGGKLSQPLIVIAISIDIITSPIQAVYFLWRLDNAWEG